MASSELQGREILVTRPRAHAQRLARLIEEVGGIARLFPAIEIEDVPMPEALKRLHEFDLAIFVSPTAVEKVMRQMPGAWPSGLRVAAVGSGTRRELEKHGIADVIAPAGGADSEALLATPQLGAVAGQRIAILRGDGGRALLGDTFVERGARVEHITCYRRLLPRPPARPWKAGELAAVTVSSSQGLDNLFEVLDREMLRATPLFVPHPRIAERARTLAVREVVLAGHSDEQMLERLVAYFRSHG